MRWQCAQGASWSRGSAALENTLSDRGEVWRQRDLGQGRVALEASAILAWYKG